MDVQQVGQAQRLDYVNAVVLHRIRLYAHTSDLPFEFPLHNCSHVFYLYFIVILHYYSLWSRNLILLHLDRLGLIFLHPTNRFRFTLKQFRVFDSAV